MWEAEGWAWRSQSRTAMAESISDCFTVPLPWVLFSLLPAFSPAPLCSCWCLSFTLSATLSFFHLHFFFFFFSGLDNRNVQSFFNGARNYISSGLVQYCCPLPLPDNEDVCLKRYMALVLISNYSLSLCLSVCLLFTETIFTCQTACHK